MYYHLRKNTYLRLLIEVTNWRGRLVTNFSKSLMKIHSKSWVLGIISDWLAQWFLPVMPLSRRFWVGAPRHKRPVQRWGSVRWCQSFAWTFHSSLSGQVRLIINFSDGFAISQVFHRQSRHSIHLMTNMILLKWMILRDWILSLLRKGGHRIP